MNVNDEINISLDHIVRLYKKYGHNKLCVIAMEECAELQQAISKYIRGDNDLTNLTEEMAHVLICIDELSHMLGIPKHKIQDEIDKKYSQFEKGGE